MRIEQVRVIFEPRDLWIGMYWDYPYHEAWQRRMRVYICLVPMLPMRITLRLRPWTLAEWEAT